MRQSGPTTIAEKILRANALEADGDFVRARVDFAMAHDATTALLIDRFVAAESRLWDPERVLFVADHFSPPANAEQAAVLRKFTDFVRALPRADLRQHDGICHQLLVEDRRVVPGQLVVGADSHTVTAGALGCLATGLGSTDMLRVLREGSTWFRVPQSIKVEVSGSLPPHVSGRDVALLLLRELGDDGAIYRSVEIHDSAGLEMDFRFALCNAVVEAGAKCGILSPDAITFDYLGARGAVPFEAALADPGAPYVRTIDLRLDGAEPMVALPGSPCSAATVKSLEGLPINRAFIGSCASGRLSDLRAAAEALAGQRVHPAVQLVIIPTSRRILQQALAEGVIQALVDAGGILAAPGCGPCGGITNGILADQEVCVSTSTRNYPGRMGHKGAKVYLASARTVAISAARGGLSA